jgi:hypothetical protein
VGSLAFSKVASEQTGFIKVSTVGENQPARAEHESGGGGGGAEGGTDLQESDREHDIRRCTARRAGRWALSNGLFQGRNLG